MRIILAAAAIVASVSFAWAAQSGQYKDGPTSEWFESLQVPDHPAEPGSWSCCDQADCHPTPANFVDGQWWAATRIGQPGETVPIPSNKIIPNTVSPFSKDGEGLAVLCEATSAGVSAQKVIGNMGSPVLVYCFVIPPTFG